MLASIRWLYKVKNIESCFIYQFKIERKADRRKKETERKKRKERRERQNRKMRVRQKCKTKIIVEKLQETE